MCWHIQYYANYNTVIKVYIDILKHDDNFGNASISNIALSAIFIGYMLHLGHCANRLFLLIDCFDIAIIVLFQKIRKTKQKSTLDLLLFYSIFSLVKINICYVFKHFENDKK